MSDKLYTIYFQCKLSKDNLWTDKDESVTWMTPHSMYFSREDAFDAKVQLNNDIDKEYKGNNRFIVIAYEPNDIPKELQQEFDNWMDSNERVWVIEENPEYQEPELEELEEE